MKVYLTLTFALLLACTGAGAALAQTPDGLPPALETVCDAETGAAYGFCTAYCEAMDCNSDDPSASETACSQVRGKFQNITGRDLPCEGPFTCPCTSLPEFSADLEGMTFCIYVVGEDRVHFGLDSTFGSLIFGNPPPVCGVSNSSGGITLPITPGEAVSCIQLVLETAENLGITCRVL